MEPSPASPITSDPTVSRREALGLTVGLWVVASAGLVGPILRLLAAPLTNPDPAGPSASHATLTVADLPASEQWTPITLRVGSHDAWRIDAETEIGAFLRKRGDKYEALSGRCTHMGCQVGYDAGKQQFTCPCHHGVFDSEGKVVSGPPTKPLESMPIRIEGDRVFIETAPEAA
ncbi:MAG: Rieske 2Fe-2S domain-containing protein [bacterium]